MLNESWILLVYLFVLVGVFGLGWRLGERSLRKKLYRTIENRYKPPKAP